MRDVDKKCPTCRYNDNDTGCMLGYTTDDHIMCEASKIDFVNVIVK